MGKCRVLFAFIGLLLLAQSFAQGDMGKILILSNTAGQVLVDGKALGNAISNTPLFHDVSAGEHLVQLAYTINGQAEVHNEVVVVEARKQKVVNITIGASPLPSGTSTTGEVAESEAVEVQEPIGPAGAVYLIRRTGYSGSLGSYSVFMDGSRICTLNNNHYSEHQVPEGEHRFTVRGSGSSEKEASEPLILTIEADKTYYLSLAQRTGLVMKLTLSELTENSGMSAITDLKLDETCE